MEVLYLDKLGRVVIPIRVRRAMNIDEKSALELNVVKGKIVIRKMGDYCKICQSSIDNKLELGICSACVKRIKNI